MIKLGETQELEVKKKSELGSYLGVEGEEGQVVFFPKSHEDKKVKVGDKVSVFIYKDSDGRMLATTNKPLLEVGEVGLLKVAAVTQIGAFLDWGLDRDILLPFKEQLGTVEEGDSVMVSLYVDKTDRMAATMKVYNILESENPYKENDDVEGIVYDIKKNLGVMIAVDGKYHGLIHSEDVMHDFEIGESVKAKVLRKRKDGKLGLSMGGKAYQTMDKDGQKIYEKLLRNDGKLGLHDKSSPDEIKSLLNMSKNAFKRAIGRMYKNGDIVIADDHIRIAEKKK